MSRMVSVDVDDMADILRRLRALETATPLFAASVTSGRVRIGGTATLLVDSSGGIVVHGSIGGDGAFTWSGILNADGTITLDGPTTINGTLAIKGASTLNGNLTVAGGGRITAGVLTIDPTGGTFGGALVSANAIDVVAPSFNTTGNIFSQGTITSNGLLRAEVNASVGSNLTVGGKITNTNMPTTPASGKTANVWQDPSTKILYRMI